MVRKASLILLALLLSTPAWAGYRGVRKAWTKSDSIYTVKNLGAILMWEATYYSREFRRAYIKKHSKLNHLSALEAAQYLAKEEADHEKHHEFFIGFFTKDEYTPFDITKDSFWKVELISSAGTLKPVKISQVPIGPYEQKMFPYLNRWSSAYRLLFPKVELGEDFQLVIQSVMGKSTLKWSAD